MRRLASSLALGLALLCASLAWSAFSTRATFLNAKRSERIADSLIAEPLVRDAAAKGLGDALLRVLPPGTPIEPAEVEAAARAALDDPRALDALKAAVVGAHQRLVGETAVPVALDVRPIAESGRDALIGAHPELAGSMPVVPDISIDLPTDRLPELGRFREPLGLAAGLGTLAAALLLAGAFFLAADRPRVLGRLGRWAFGAGVWWALIGYGLPRLAAEVGDSRLAVLGSVGKALSAPLVAPAVGLLILGAGAMLAARLWRQAQNRPSAPAPTPTPVPPRPPLHPGPRHPVAVQSTNSWLA